MGHAFFKREDGTSSVEAVILLPFYFMFLVFVVDATLLMVAQTSMWNLASDVSRLVALRKMDEVQAEAFIEETGAEVDYTADVVINGSLVTTRIDRPFSSVTIGVLSRLSGDLSVASTYRLEPNT